MIHSTYRFVSTLAVVAALQAAPTIVCAQDAAWPATLLRRVAEVADGQRVGKSVFIVVSTRFPHEVGGVFRTRDEANTAAARLPEQIVFGPVSPTIDINDIIGGHLAGGCQHDPRTSNMEGLRGTPNRICALGKMLPLENVDSVIVTTKMRDGSSLSVSRSAATMDALFFTVDAMDRFVFSYYARVFGVEYAARLRQDVIRSLPR
jgi:hypothetical protein